MKNNTSKYQNKAVFIHVNKNTKYNITTNNNNFNNNNSNNNNK